MLSNKGLSPTDAVQRCDISLTTHEMRIQNVHSRGRTIILLKSIFKRINLNDVEGTPLDPWLDLFIPTLAWFIHAMRAYADIVKPSYLDLLLRQLEWTSNRWSELSSAVERFTSEYPQPSSLLWPGYPQVTVSRAAATYDAVHDDIGMSFRLQFDFLLD